METKMELQHVSHSHPMIFYEVDKSHDGREEYCYMCWEPVSSPSYRCTQCELFLHRKCANTPIEIEHPMHRRHRLTLLWGNKDYACDMCEGKMRCTIPFYYCSLCNFRIDIRCAQLPNIMESTNHEHSFSLQCKHIHFTCDACGEDGEYAPYLCTLCHLTVHKDCVSLPKTIRIIRHEHPINHTYFIREIEFDPEFDCCPCAICHFEVDMERGCYYCLSCDYVVHALCATRSDIWDGKAKLVEDENSNKESNELILDSITGIINEIKLGEEVIATEIQHFSHEHTLKFSDEVNKDKCCDGCMLPISPPFYSCVQCSFFLHKTCVDLPQKKEHPFHPHPLCLLSQAPYSTGFFCCDACSQFFHGFSFNCERCNFNLDLRCASISYNLKHDCHEHPLIAFFNARYAQKCDSCDQIAHNKVKCVDCDYHIDFKCATLPYIARHKNCNHLLSLTYQDDAEEHYCDVCEGERDPTNWFYSCSICYFEAHPDCILGKQPYLKLGKTYTGDAHPHPLTFVKKTRNYPSCSFCGEPCKELTLECGEPECNYTVHWECRL